MNRIALLVGCFGFLAVACSGSVGGACDPEKEDADQTCEKDCDPSTDTAGAAWPGCYGWGPASGQMAAGAPARSVVGAAAFG